MSRAKWFMKQYWRVGTIRALLGVTMGMLVLGRYYYGFIPPLAGLGLFGAVILATIFLLIFLGAGYLYDESGHLWNEQIQVITERDPYSYVPNFRFLLIEYPFFYGFLNVIQQIIKKLGLESTEINQIVDFLDKYFALEASNIKDIDTSILMSTEYMQAHPFLQGMDLKVSKVELRSRIKKQFQTQMWRLDWTQNFTGLGQDVLVFAALYIGILIPAAVNESGVVTFDYMLLGILTISLPLYIGLVIAGWFYDKKLRLWSPDTVVKIERTPYSYVPDPNLLAKIYPFLFAMISFLKKTFQSLGMNASNLDEISNYLYKYGELGANRDQDMDTARAMRRELGRLFVKWENTQTKEEI